MLGKVDIHIQKNNVGLLPHTIYKINSKCIKDLTMKAKSTRLLEENTGINLHELGLGNGLLDMTLKHTQQ